MVEENEVKISKSEEKQNFLKELEAKTQALKETEERIKALVERNEDLAARNLLGGRTDAGIQPAPVKEETAQEYAHRIAKNDLRPGEG